MTPPACTNPEPFVLTAPPAWRVVDFLSDVHLFVQEQPTAQAWMQYLLDTSADAVFILGDLFEVWVGDDCLTSPPQGGVSFEQTCCQALRHVAAKRPVFVMHGNRDFLLGEGFAACAGVQLLRDPTVLRWGTQAILLSHGDAWCTDDQDYMQFRQQVRTPAWQHEFLGKPLAERQQLARAIRTQSEARKRKHQTYADINFSVATQCMESCGANLLIHGHTHRPSHDFMHPTAPAAHISGNLSSIPVPERFVLSDWHAQSAPPRLEVLRLSLQPTESCLAEHSAQAGDTIAFARVAL